MNLSSEWQVIECKADTVFQFVSNANNFEKLMPEQVVNWKADYDTCSFTIKGMTDLHLRIDERLQNKLVRLIPNGKSPFEFEILTHLRSISSDRTEAKVEINAEINPMLALMAKRPLQNLVNIIAEKLSHQPF